MSTLTKIRVDGVDYQLPKGGGGGGWQGYNVAIDQNIRANSRVSGYYEDHSWLTLHKADGNDIVWQMYKDREAVFALAGQTITGVVAISIINNYEGNGSTDYITIATPGVKLLGSSELGEIEVKVGNATGGEIGCGRYRQTMLKNSPWYWTGYLDTDRSVFSPIMLFDNITIKSITCPACLSPDTHITLADGTQTELRNIKVGDRVKCFDENGNITDDEVVYADANQHKTYRRRNIYTFSDGTEIIAIHPHRFYNVERQACVYLHEWMEGEHAIKADGTEVSLVSHIWEDGEWEHATLFTRKYNNYFAAGICAGNRDTIEMHLGSHSSDPARPSVADFGNDHMEWRVFSKLYCVASLIEAGVWPRVKRWIEENGLYDLYLAAQDFAENNEWFRRGRDALGSELGWTDEQIEALLAKCVLRT